MADYDALAAKLLGQGDPLAVTSDPLAASPTIVTPSAEQEVARQAPAPQVSDSNPYDAIAERMLAKPSRDQKAADLEAVRETDPDKFARSKDLAEKSGVPLATVERNFDLVTAKQTAEENAEALEGAPATSRFLDSDPDNLKLSWDAVGQLVQVEKNINTVRALAAGAFDTPGMALRGWGAGYKATAELLNRGLGETLRAAGLGDVVDAIHQGTSFEIPWWLNPAEILSRPGQAIGETAQQINIRPEDANFATDVAGGLGQFAAQITAALLSGGTVTLAMMFGQGMEQAAEDVAKAGATGTPQGNAAILAGGAITGATERWGLNNILQRIPSTVRSRIGQILAGATSEGFQEISEKVLNNLAAIGLYDRERQLVDWDTVYEGGVGFTVGGVISAVIPGRQSIRIKENMDKVAEAVASSPLTLRSRDASVQHTAEALKEAEIDVFVPAAKLAEIAGSDPEKAKAFYDKIGVTDSIQGALERGGDVRVPEQGFARMMVDGEYEAVSDVTRYGPDAASAADAKASVKEAVSAAAEIAPEPEVAAETITDPQRKKLEKAGFTPEDIAGMTPQDAVDLLNEKPKPDKFHFDPEAKPVELAVEQMGLQGLFTTAREAGLDNAGYADYLVQRAQAAEASVELFKKRMLKQREQQNSGEWKAAQETVTVTVLEEANNKPVYSAFDGIGRERLDAAAVSQILLDLGETDLGKLPTKDKGRAIFTSGKEQGLDPDIYAQNYGYEDGEAMIRDFLLSPPKQEFIDFEVNRRMTEQFSHLTEERDLVKAALEDLHNDKQAGLLKTELDALRGARKEGALKPALFRRAAKENIGRLKVAEVSVPMFLAEEQRKGREAGRLVKKGDRAGAAKAKYQQLLNFEYAREAYTVRRELDRQRRQMNKLSNPRKKQPNIDAEHLDRIRDILVGYNLDKSKPKENDGRVHWSEMKVEDWRRLYQGVKQTEAEGRAWKSYKIGGRKLDFIDLRNSLVEATDKLPTIGRVERQQVEQNPGLGDRIRSQVATFDAAAGKVELMLERLDGGQKTGKWKKAVYVPLAQAQTAKLDMVDKVVRPPINALVKMPKAVRKRLRQKFVIAGLGNRRMTGANILMMALNSGNTSNMSKMVDGFALELNPRDPQSATEQARKGVDEALAHLGPEEAAWVQEIWDSFEKMRPLTEEIYREEYGISPKKIEAETVKIGGKTLKGGYFPMLYDPERVADNDHQTTDQVMKNPFVAGSVFSGMQEARSEGFAAPVDLQLRNLPHALERHIHYITHYDAVRDVRKILNDEVLANAVRAKLGPEYHSELKGWLESVATNGADRSGPHMRKFNAIVQGFRSRLTAAILGGSYTTLAAQSLGLSTAASEIGAKWVAVGLDHYLANPAQTRTIVFEASGEMRHRLRNANQDVAQSIDHLEGRSGFWAEQQRAGLMAIGYAQTYMVDIPTWLGAYNKAISEGQIESDAVLYADSVVRTTQGSGHTKDLSAFQRQRGVMQALTMFSTYTMLLYNLEVQAVRDMKKLRNVPRSVAKLSWLILLPTIAEAFLRAQAPEEDDEELAWWSLRTAKYAMSAVPLVGRGFASVAEGYDFNVSPIEALPGAWVKATKDVIKAIDEDRDMTLKEIADVVKAVGMTIGFSGTTQITRMLKAADEDDPGLYDFLVGPQPK